MRSRRVPMTLEEYELLPFEPGWKCEYVDGCAHFTPRHHAIITSLKVAPRQLINPPQIRPALPSDVPMLVEPYAAAFGETIEYCDYSRQQVKRAARDALQSHFAGLRGEPHPASRVAFELCGEGGEERLIGAALLVTGEFGAMLDLLFVAPDRQRRGVAEALASSVVNELHRLGHATLTSRYHIGNEQSRDWHRRFGFVELPDLAAARLYEQAARQELWRREKLGELTPRERERLRAECRRWGRHVKKLERLEAEEGFEAVHPNLRWW